jgi:hypothetical protein
MVESNVRRRCSTSKPDLGGERCGALLGSRLLRYDTDYTESALDVQRQHSRAIGSELACRKRKNTAYDWR